LHPGVLVVAPVRGDRVMAQAQTPADVRAAVGVGIEEVVRAEIDPAGAAASELVRVLVQDEVQKSEVDADVVELPAAPEPEGGAGMKPGGWGGAVAELGVPDRVCVHAPAFALCFGHVAAIDVRALRRVLRA